MFNNMDIDVLMTQGARAWVAMILIASSQNLPVAAPEGGLNIKMSSLQYRDPHVKDTMALSLTWDPHTWDGTGRFRPG